LFAWLLLYQSISNQGRVRAAAFLLVIRESLKNGFKKKPTDIFLSIASNGK
jgi:hypothetical protein